MREIITLEIDYSFGDNKDTIYPVVLKDEKNITLVDCGYSGSLTLIEGALKNKNISPKHITSIIITHHDHDHIGALADFKEKYPQVKIMASEIEEPFIAGKEKSFRLTQAEALQASLPIEQKSFGDHFIQILKSVRPVRVDQVVQINEVLDICGGCRIIDTHGHTPGHISLLLEDMDTFIAGDAAIIEDGILQIANPQFTIDKISAENALNLVKHLPVSHIICYHGGILMNHRHDAL